MPNKCIQSPAPGCNEAIAKGCICPVEDNNHGIGVRQSGATSLGAYYYVDLNCPLHKKLVDD